MDTRLQFTLEQEMEHSRRMHHVMQYTQSVYPPVAIQGLSALEAKLKVIDYEVKTSGYTQYDRYYDLPMVLVTFRRNWRGKGGPAFFKGDEALAYHEDGRGWTVFSSRSVHWCRVEPRYFWVSDENLDSN